MSSIHKNETSLLSLEPQCNTLGIQCILHVGTVDLGHLARLLFAQLGKALQFGLGPRGSTCLPP